MNADSSAHHGVHAGASSGCGLLSNNEQQPAENKRGATAAGGSRKPPNVNLDAGRTVTIPTEVNSVYCADADRRGHGGHASPDKDHRLGERADRSGHGVPARRACFDARHRRLDGQQVTANMEDIITLDPDVIIYVGTDGTRQRRCSDQIQKETGIPVVCASGCCPRAYRRGHRTLGGGSAIESRRGERLATYYETKLADVVKKIDAIPIPASRVYYAENSDGLTTDPTGSSHRVLDYCKVTNVADVEMKSGQVCRGFDRAGYLVGSRLIYAIRVSCLPMTSWRTRSGPTSGRERRRSVHHARAFNWFDRRTSCASWASSGSQPCYPDIIDIEQEVKDFYKLFYRVDLSDTQVTSLLNQDQLSFSNR